LTVPVSTFTASDNILVTSDYCLTEMNGPAGLHILDEGNMFPGHAIAFAG